MEYMKTVAQLIEEFFQQEGWKYDVPKREEERIIFAASLNMGNILGRLRIFILLRKDYYVVNTILNNAAEEDRRTQVGEYLHRANYAMSNGNFEFDYDDGEVKYKTYVNFDGGVNLSPQVIEDSMLVSIFMFEKYGKNLLKLMLEPGNPKQLIEEAERSYDEEMRQNTPGEDTTSLS